MLGLGVQRFHRFQSGRGRHLDCLQSTKHHYLYSHRVSQSDEALGSIEGMNLFPFPDVSNARLLLLIKGLTSGECGDWYLPVARACPTEGELVPGFIFFLLPPNSRFNSRSLRDRERSEARCHALESQRVEWQPGVPEPGVLPISDG